MSIAVAQSLISTAAQAPLDARTVVATLADIAEVENPYVGMEIYVRETEKKYRIKTLTETSVGTRTVYTVGTYEAIPDAGDLSGKAAASDVSSLAGRVSDLESAVGSFESQAEAVIGEESAGEA